jgi:uncharacterized protein
LPRSSSPERASLLIAAISGRALAASARRAGLTPLVADFFADADTLAIAHACRKLDGGLAAGIPCVAIEAALEALASLAPSPILGFVYGSGFEDRPDLLRRIAARWPFIGNDARTVERLKAPESFFSELARLGIAHPRTVTTPPATPEGWLAKRRGGAGGSHIVTSHIVASPIAPSPLQGGGPQVYYQEMVPGRPVSALFIADGEQVCVLGFSEQWTAPTPRSPWRYGGAVQPAELPNDVKYQMVVTVERVAAVFGVKGLGSADFMVNDRDALLLEINPRPGATLDIFESDALPLLRLHLDAVVERRLPSAALKLPDAIASAIVYARKAITVPKGMDWPDWTADRPKCGERIDKNRPICTVGAHAKTATGAKRLVEERISIILAAIGGPRRGEASELDEQNGGERNASNGVAERQHQGRAAGPRSHC